MNISQFEARLAKHNLGAAVNGRLHPNKLCIYDKTSQQTVGLISMNEIAVMDTGYMQFNAYPPHKCMDLLNLFFEFAITPIEERQYEERTEAEDEFVFEYTGSKAIEQYFTYDIHTQTVEFRADPWNGIPRWRFTASNITDMPKEAQDIMLALTKRPYSDKIQREAEGESDA